MELRMCVCKRLYVPNDMLVPKKKAKVEKGIALLKVIHFFFLSQNLVIYRSAKYQSPSLNIRILRANSADDKLKIFFLFFPRK